MTSHANKKIILQCAEKDGESRLTIDMKMALQSKVIMELIKPSLLTDLEEINVVLPDIKFSTMLKVVTYLTRHIEESEKAFDYYTYHKHEGINACVGKEHEGIEVFDGHKHQGLEAVDGEEPEDIESFDAKFIDVDPGSLFLRSHAANYLKIRSLMDLTCRTLSSKIKGKTPEEIEEAVKNWKRSNKE
ncbi:hypothetical protein AgCh_001314 [Apium graveolens]